MVRQRRGPVPVGEGGQARVVGGCGRSLDGGLGGSGGGGGAGGADLLAFRRRGGRGAVDGAAPRAGSGTERAGAPRGVGRLVPLARLGVRGAGRRRPQRRVRRRRVPKRGPHEAGPRHGRRRGDRRGCGGRRGATRRPGQRSHRGGSGRLDCGWSARRRTTTGRTIKARFGGSDGDDRPETAGPDGRTEEREREQTAERSAAHEASGVEATSSDGSDRSDSFDYLPRPGDETSNGPVGEDGQDPGNDGVDPDDDGAQSQ